MIEMSVSIDIDPRLLSLAPRVKRGVILGLLEAGDRAVTFARKPNNSGFKNRTDSLRTRIVRDDKVDTDKLSISVGINETKVFGDPNNPPYGFYLNYGTKNKDGSWRIRPKKFIEKGVEHAMERIKRIMESNIYRELSR